MRIIEGPTDLDELVATCRAQRPRQVYAEAVACYRSGAYRAAIVTAWVSVVFDYLAKLRELDLGGNAQATDILARFERARVDSDWVTSQRLEKELAADAETRFDLLTPIERQDIERLLEDRHRCAHPSMHTTEEPYQPSAEQARLHLRNAAVHLLSRPPLQGKEAWDLIWADVSSIHFPEVHDEAVAKLRARTTRARASLVRRIAIELTKALLTRARVDVHPQQRRALRALVELHHDVVEAVLRDKLETLVDRTGDAELDLVVRYVLDVPVAWSGLAPGSQQRLISFLTKTTDMSALAMAHTIEVMALRDVGLRRVGSLTDEEIVQLAKLVATEHVLDDLVRRMTTGNFISYSHLRKALKDENLATAWTLDQRRRMVDALRTNTGVHAYMGFGGTIEEVLKLCAEVLSETSGQWRELLDVLSLRRQTLAEARTIQAAFPGFPLPPAEPPTSGGTA